MSSLCSAANRLQLNAWHVLRLRLCMCVSTCRSQCTRMQCMLLDEALIARPDPLSSPHFQAGSNAAYERYLIIFPVTNKQISISTPRTSCCCCGFSCVRSWECKQIYLVNKKENLCVLPFAGNVGARRKTFAIHFNFSRSILAKFAGKNYEKCSRYICVCVC